MIILCINHRTVEGSALIITLIFLTLISLLVIGFLGEAMIGVSSGQSHLMGVEATLYAEAGPNIVLNRLQTSMTTNSGTFLTNVSYWITQPGQITFISKAGATNIVDLSSGATSATDSMSAVDLNAPSLEGLSPMQINSDPTIGTHMYIKWIYIRKNGTLDTTSPPTLIANDPNPIVGRFAFWTDDAGARINLNTAEDRGTNNASNPTYISTPSAYPPNGGLAQPSFVNLEGIPFATPLTISDAIALNNYRWDTNHFNSVLDAAAVTNSPTLCEALTNQDFSLTHYNHSPNLNMFNQPRMMLTTQATNLPGGTATSGVTNFIDILTTPNTDPGPVANLSITKVSGIVNYLMQEMTRTDWPIMPGQSFQSKYNNSPTQIALLAMNIVDYVRSAESTNSLVIPLRGYIAPSGSTYTFTYNPTTGNLLSGGRRLYLSKVELFPVGSKPGRTLSLKIEVFLPLPPTGENNQDISANLSTDVGVWDDYSMPSNLYYMSNIVTPGGASILYGGQYATSYFPATNADNTFTGSVALAIYPPIGATPLNAANDKFDFSPVNGNLSFPHITGQTNVYSVIDPAVNKATNDYSLGTATGPSNPITNVVLTNIASSSVVPQQDTDSTGTMLYVGWRAPAPKGTASNPYGRVLSVGELGFIPTGMDAGANATTSQSFSDSQYLGAPWRSVRLQPQKQTGVLPDWALLDLFCVPLPVANARDLPFIQPNTESVGGQINPNPIVPYGTTVARQAPLLALLYGASPDSVNTITTTSTPSVATLAANIYNHTLATGGENYGFPGQFVAPGEIAEIQGIADGGEASEALVREIIGQTSVRGNVFSIYSVGQALKEDSSGGIHVLGEARYQTMIERVEPSYATNAATPTRYLPVFSRRLE